MIKRTAGYVLMLFLVITGLGSQISTPTLGAKERRFLVTHLKDSRSQFLNSIEDLTATQLAFKPAADKWSVNECIQHLALSEKSLWSWADGVLKQPRNAGMRSKIKLTDEEVIATVSSRTQKVKASETLDPAAAKWSNSTETVEAFKEDRAHLIKYVRTTTLDVRHHVTETASGPLDAYQLMLLISAHTTRHIQQIEEIKREAAFPK